MVAKTSDGKGKKLYQCSQCNMRYETEELARKCEEWCAEHKSCNLEIIKNSVDYKE
ncbi:hypothetical protein HRbin34_00617 [bacterium HR34]|nr:hypothetical protein HRbin34_00617 [bacterium HR34]